MLFFRKNIIEFFNFLDGLFPEKFFWRNNNSSKLTIFNLHSTSEEFFPQYKSLLSRLKNEGDFINPSNIDDFFNNKTKGKSLFLLTFDDGFKNNLKFAKQVLTPLNIKAIFFIIPKFIYSYKKKTNYEYFRKLYPSQKYRLNKKNFNQFVPLSKKNINKLVDLGHTIGMHGLEHENFGDLTKDKVKGNIKKGIKIFSELGIKVEHFAYPFGDKNSFNNQSNIIIKSYFKYIYSGLRGFNYSKIIKRNTVLKDTPYHPMGKT